MMAKSSVYSKTTRTLIYRLAAVVLIFLSTIFVPVQATAATTAGSSKTKLGWHYAYDKQGRIVSITNPANKKTKIRYTQNKKGGISAITRELPGGSIVKFKFNKYGRRTEMVDSAGTVRYVYDKFGRLSKVHRKGTPSITYGYDVLGRIKSISIGPQFTLQYGYDFRGRPEKIITPVGNILFGYNSKTGTVMRRLPNGISTRWTNQPDGRLKSITHTSSGNRTLAQYQYAYRLDGLITFIKELTPSGVQTRTYRYDTAQRLISASGASRPKVEFDYDKLGNRTELRRQDRKPVSAQHDWAGRLARYDGRVCQHDPVGNLTSCTGSSKSFTFGDTGLLKTASLKNGNIKYSYDGDGYLISRSNGANRQTFLPDPLSDVWQPLVVKDSRGQQTFYLWNGASPLMAITGKQARYFLHDHLGSVRLVTDRRGEIIERLDYTPFGQPEKKVIGADLQPGFAGLFFDKAASVYLTRARAYDPELGRFLQPDPEHRVPGGSQKDLSVYAYCGGDPINFLDLNGVAPQRVAAASVGFVDIRGGVQLGRQWIDDRIQKNFQLMNKHPNDMFRTAGGWAANAGWQFVAEAHSFGADVSIGVQTAGESWGTHLSNPSKASLKKALLDTGSATIGVGGLVFPALKSLKHSLSIEGLTVRVLHKTGHLGKIISAGRTSSLRAFIEIADATKDAWELRGLAQKVGDQWGSKFIGSRGVHNSRAGRDWSVPYNSRSATFGSSRETFSGAAFNKSYAEFERTGVYRDPFKANRFSGFNESKVGGIRLIGAGSALSHLGELEGIALDETNGRLILIGKGQRPINLPPLRLDDVVTIFRSVYKHGESPSVSIDPISDKETEKWMTVRHGAATENTYVGWVLYEADLIMKNYGLGKDNKTKKKIYSRVPGYMEFKRIGPKSRKPLWERYWIVPDSLTRIQGKTQELTMFDIPLKLETEKMEWVGGKLVTARIPKPSKSAAAFTNWFTRQYDKIAREVKLSPPKHCGFKQPVAVYEELRRIALITGIAETLRDQNVSFPAWMNDYPVKPCISDSKTPVLTVTGDGYKASGGVLLAVSDKNMRTRKGDKEVSQLAKIIRHKTAGKPLFAPVSFQQNGKTYNAVTLPGTGTRRSGANILRHTDLTAPVLQETGIELTRHFNSFYDPHGMFGRGWTLDLPRLESQQQPVSRTETGISYKTVYQLISPLNSWSERFVEIGIVPEVGGKLMVPATSGEMLGLADSNLRIIGQKTRELIFRDGRSWHFDENGYLIARHSKKTMVIYKRDKNHRIGSIKSWNLQGSSVSSSKPDARLNLTYDDKLKRVRSIEALSPKLGKPVKALYFYDKNGQLIMVLGTGGKSEYAYRNGFVVSVKRDGKKQVLFEYNMQGQLQKEKRADGKKVVYKRTRTSYGTKVVAIDSITRKPMETVEYDANFRPLRRMFDDGSKIAWNRKEKALETTVTQADGEYYTVSESNDGRHSTMKTSTGETYTADFDSAGRVTRAHLDGGPTLNQKWNANGRLQSAISDEQGVLPGYTRDGKLASVVVTSPDQARTQQISQYVKTDYDPKGRVTNVTDDSGSRLQIGYDKSGQPSVIRSQRGTVTIDRDTKGQVREVGTTWGFAEKYDYDKKTSNLSRIILQQHYAGTAPEQASIELTDGRISKVRQLDGGETTLNYYQKGTQKGLLKKVHTTGKLALAYSYDSSARLTGIDIGDGNAAAYRVNYNYDSKGRLTGISYTPASGR